jgi:pimeloyl-ACP methyl ester carboxylesterase
MHAKPDALSNPARRSMMAAAVASAVATAGCAQAQPAADGASRKKTFVLLAPAWAGAWIYRDTAQWLRAQGHAVHTPTLTGLADRSHLLRADVDMDTHVSDVINYLKWEDLHDVVLVGHSFTGGVVSGVAEKALDRLASAVFVNAYVHENGRSVQDYLSQRSHSDIDARLKKGELGLPNPPAAFYALPQKEWARIDGLHTPHPLGAIVQKMKLTGALEKVPKKTYVMLAKFARGREYELQHFNRVKNAPGWNAVSVEMGHLAMVDDPVGFARLLLDAA